VLNHIHKGACLSPLLLSTAQQHQHQLQLLIASPLLSTPTHTTHLLYTHTGARPPCEYMHRGHRVAAAAAAAASTRFRVLCLLLAAVASTSSGKLMCMSLFSFRSPLPPSDLIKYGSSGLMLLYSSSAVVVLVLVPHPRSCTPQTLILFFLAKTSTAFLIRAPTITLARTLSSTKSATLRTSMSAAPATIATEGKKSNPFKFSWQQTMLRIKDPAKSLPFYEEVC